MDRRKKKFRLPALKKAIAKRWDSNKRKLEKFGKGFQRRFSGLMQLKESSVALNSDDRRKLPAGLSYINPIFWFVQSSVFLFRYLQTRQSGAAIRALPAIVGLLFPVVLEIRLAPGIQEQISQTRAMQVQAAIGKDNDRVEYLLRKLELLTPEDLDVKLARAVLLDQFGRVQEAEKLAADLGNQGYVPAVEWLSSKQFTAIVKNPEKVEAADRDLETSLLWILARQSENRDALFRLATFRMLRGQFEKARENLRTLTGLPGGAIAEAWYSLAVVENSLVDSENRGDDSMNARNAAEAAANAFLKQNATLPYDQTRFLQLVRSLVLAHREAEAIRQIGELAAEKPDLAVALQSLIVEVHLAQSKRLRTAKLRSAEDVTLAIDCVVRAMAIAPAEQAVMDELIALAGVKDLSDQLLEQQLQTALNAGVSPGLVHFILGTRAMSRTPPDTETALSHFALAQTHDPGMPGLLNNMADTIAEMPNADLDQALVLVEQAVRMLPDQPRVYDTRGKIYLRKGEWLKAVADFEKALAAEDLRLSVHLRLVEAYEGLGNQTQVQYHRAMADALMELQKPEVSLEKTTLTPQQ